MCKVSLEFKRTIDAELGQSLQVKDIPALHANFRPFVRGFAPVGQDSTCEGGVCFKTGWGLLFTLTQTQVETLGLKQLFNVDTIGDESGATIFARFVEGKAAQNVHQHEEDKLVFEIDDQKQNVLFDHRFAGVYAKAVAAPGDPWPPTPVVTKTHQSPIARCAPQTPVLADA